MRIFALSVLGLLALGSLSSVAKAQQADSCIKECRAFHRACVQNHSQAACKVDLDICMKHCGKK